MDILRDHATYDIQTLKGDTFQKTISLAQRPEWQQPMIRKAFEILQFRYAKYLEDTYL